MFGTQIRAPRPIVLVFVYGVFLAIVAITATMQGLLISAHFSTSVIGAVVGTDAGVVTAFANGHLTTADLSAGLLSADRVASMRTAMTQFTAQHGIVRVEVRTTDGRVVASDGQSVGMVVAPSADILRAVGQQQAEATFLDPDGATGAAPGDLPAVSLLREVFPLVEGGTVLGVAVIWRDATPIIGDLDTIRREILIVTFSAALVAAAVLSLVFRSAQGRISRQTAALLDAARRDPLTGLLSHGAAVELLAETTERLRADPSAVFPLGILDIDNFRLLNETHGHPAGDRAIAVVLDTLRAHLHPGMAIGRFGPDELLVFGEDVPLESLDSGLQAFRASLASIAFRPGDGDAIALTVSAALCSYPDDGMSVTALLATAAVTLQEAKASGGDAIRRPLRGDEPAEAANFNVFRGLILAIDTKDRYTKRHSEDVARYALFIARIIGLPAEEVEAVRIAGLLHDVGKIGIPDAILRKPGRLTQDEFEIVKQHVALGDMIVRDIPGIDYIRTGIRHHHERVDGRGYLDALAGDDIPLIARILAVGDAFSAMTTSRPYRKGMDVDEALRRLEDAAGSALDPRLVEVFVRGIESVDGAPLPDDDSGRLWVPASRVA